MVIPSDHESKIAVEERRAVNTRQGEWQMQKKHGYKRVSLQNCKPICWMGWRRWHVLNLFFNWASTLCQVPGYVGWYWVVHNNKICVFRLIFLGGGDNKKLHNQREFPQWLSNKESPLPCWAGMIPRRRKWQPTPGFLPEEFRGQRSLAGYSPKGCKGSDTTEAT